jgi:hypothetical protein
MAPRFARGRHGGVTVRLDEIETALLRQIADEMLALLDEGADTPAADEDPLAAAVGIGTATSAPDDPALARLLPDAYADDPEAAAEFRRYTETGLRERKRAAARTLLATLGEPGRKVHLDAEQAQAWLGALNDARLTLGTRLGVTEDLDELFEDMDDADPRMYGFAVYDHLTYLQEALVQALR